MLDNKELCDDDVVYRIYSSCLMHNSHDVHAAGFASYYPGINYPPCSPSSQSEEGITGMPLLPQGHLVYKIGCEEGGEQ